MPNQPYIFRNISIVYAHAHDYEDEDGGLPLIFGIGSKHPMAQSQMAPRVNGGYPKMAIAVSTGQHQHRELSLAFSVLER